MAAKREKTRTPGIFKRGDRYCFAYRVEGKQRWESCRTLDEARRERAKRTADIERGEFEERSRVTLREYATAWIERYQGRGRRGFRDNTRDEYRRQLEKYVFGHFPERMRLTDLSPSRIAAFVGWLCDAEAQGKRGAEERRRAKALKLGVAPSTLPLTEKDANGHPLPIVPVTLTDATIHNIVAPLRACLATAVREGLIRSNPGRDIDMPSRKAIESSDEEDVRAMSRDELATLLELIPSHWRLFFRLLASTGLRISEAIALQGRHLELDGASPHVKVRRALVKGRMGPPKSRYGRRDVPLGHELVVALRALQRGPDELVFAAANGSPIMPGNLRRRVLKAAAEEAGVSWVGFHAFRHTCASLLFAEGRNAVQVQRWLGHHSAAFTLATYVHLLDGDIGEPLALPVRSSEGGNGVVTEATPRPDIDRELAEANLAVLAA